MVNTGISQQPNFKLRYNTSIRKRYLIRLSIPWQKEKTQNWMYFFQQPAHSTGSERITEHISHHHQPQYIHTHT